VVSWTRLTAKSALYSRLAVAPLRPAASVRYSGRNATTPLYANEKPTVTSRKTPKRRSASSAR